MYVCIYTCALTHTSASVGGSGGGGFGCAPPEALLCWLVFFPRLDSCNIGNCAVRETLARRESVSE